MEAPLNQKKTHANMLWNYHYSYSALKHLFYCGLNFLNIPIAFLDTYLLFIDKGYPIFFHVFVTNLIFNLCHPVAQYNIHKDSVILTILYWIHPISHIDIFFLQN